MTPYFPPPRAFLGLIMMLTKLPVPMAGVGMHAPRGSRRWFARVFAAGSSTMYGGLPGMSTIGAWGPGWTRTDVEQVLRGRGWRFFQLVVQRHVISEWALFLRVRGYWIEERLDEGFGGLGSICR